MISITKQGDTTTYGVNEYVVDTDQEINDIQNAKVGSTAYSIESGNEYLKTQNGTWTIKGIGTGGTSGPIDLPDNLLYAYDMTEEEFWSNYSDGTLNDGLYAYESIEGLYSSVNTLSTELSDPSVMGSSSTILKNNDSYWIYNNRTFIQVSDSGRELNKIYLSDYGTFDNIPTCNAVQNHLGIDQYDFIYMSSYMGNFDNKVLLAIDTEGKQINIIDSHIDDTNGSEDSAWVFRQISYCVDSTTNWLNNDFKVKDGGTFGALISKSHLEEYDWSSEAYRAGKIKKIGYFKNGKKLLEFTPPEWPNKIDRNSNLSHMGEFFIANYDTNEFYSLNFREVALNEYNTKPILTLNCYDINGNETTYDLIDDAYNVGFDSKSQMFIRNNILYGHIAGSGYCYTFLFDLNTKTIIQTETLPFAGYHGTIWYQTFNDIYHNQNYSLIALPAYLISGGGDSLVFIKINYIENTAYLEYWAEEGSFLHNIRKETTFADKCFNDDYFYIDEDNKFYHYNFMDKTSYEHNNVILEHYAAYSKVEENNLLIVSYAGSCLSTIFLDLTTGNINMQNENHSLPIDIVTAPATPSLIVFPNKRSFLYQGAVLGNYDSSILKIQYSRQFIGQTNNNYLWIQSLNGYPVFECYTEKPVNKIKLIYKNNIVLSKTLII